MHPDFADWYRVCSVTPTPEVVERRSEAVEEFASAVQKGDLVDLLATACIPGRHASQRLRGAVIARDVSFAAHGAEEELRVLAAAVLRVLMLRGGAAGDAAALGFVAASFGDRAGSLPYPSHLEAARLYLVDRADALRSGPTVGPPKRLELQANDLAAEMPAGAATGPQVSTAVSSVLTKFLDAANSVLSETAAAIESLQVQLAVQAEESNSVWWYLGGRSSTLQLAFEEVAPAAAAIVFASELAALTKIVPASQTTTALLLRALGKSASAEATILGSVAGLSREWREQAEEAVKLTSKEGPLCPVLLAIGRSLTTSGPEWKSAYQAESGIDPEQPLSVQDLGVGFLKERLFMTGLGRLKDA